MRKAHFYIKRLMEKGWTEEEIRKRCNILPPRLERLKMIRTIPTRLEVNRLRSMLRVTRHDKLEDVKSVWESAVGPPQEKEKPIPNKKHHEIVAKALTERQREVLAILANVSMRGLPHTILRRGDASVATGLSKKMLVERIVEEIDGKEVKMFGLTPGGVAGARFLGLKATVI